MNFRNLFYLVFSTIVCLQSCQTIDDPSINVANDFDIIFQKSLNPNDLTIHALVNTTKKWSCPFEDSIQYSIQNNAEVTNIDIQGIYHNEACDDVPDFLIKSIPIELNKSEVLHLDVSLKSEIHNYFQIMNTHDGMEIIAQDLNGINLRQNYVYDIPENLIWGYVYPVKCTSNNSPNNNEFVNPFLKLFEVNFGKSELSPGFYSYFSINSNKELKLLNNPLNLNNIYTFYFKHANSQEELDVFFKKLSSSYNQILVYQIFLGNGKIYQSSNIMPMLGK